MDLDKGFDQRNEMELLARYVEGTLNSELSRTIREIENKHVVSFEEELTQLPSAQRNVELEKVVVAFKRPSLLVKNGRLEQTLSEEWGALLDLHADDLGRAMAAVGRIELKNHESLEWNGTGFLIAGNRIVTNRHVAKDFVKRNGTGFEWKTNDYSGKYVTANVDFFEEHKNPEEKEFKISDVEYLANDDAADLAILTLAESPDIAPLEMFYDAEPGRMIVAAGYPWKDSRATSKLEEIHLRIFKDIYNVKRAAPGQILENNGDRLHHDCSTLKGNSGSACIDLETGTLVGVHYGGSTNHNRAVTSRKLAEIAGL
ncbi:MAG: endonuclease G [Arenicella sp.]|jgi:endonuclease G